jgi:hypothetical protein
MSRYAGKTLTIIKPEFVERETSISEFTGHSGVLTTYNDLEYNLPTSDSWKTFYVWSISTFNIENLLEQGAISIS